MLHVPQHGVAGHHPGPLEAQPLKGPDPFLARAHHDVGRTEALGDELHHELEEPKRDGGREAIDLQVPGNDGEPVHLDGPR